MVFVSSAALTADYVEVVDPHRLVPVKRTGSFSLLAAAVLLTARLPSLTEPGPWAALRP